MMALANVRACTLEYFAKYVKEFFKKNIKIHEKNSLTDEIIFLVIGGCKSTSCKNGGVCQSDGTCSCQSSYSGTYCENCKTKLEKVFFNISAIS